MKNVVRVALLAALLSTSGCAAIVFGAVAGGVGAVTWNYVQTHQVVRK